jgi:hypothetical protein
MIDPRLTTAIGDIGVRSGESGVVMRLLERCLPKASRAKIERGWRDRHPVRAKLLGARQHGGSLEQVE